MFSDLSERVVLLICLFLTTAAAFTIVVGDETEAIDEVTYYGSLIGDDDNGWGYYELSSDGSSAVLTAIYKTTDNVARDVRALQGFVVASYVSIDGQGGTAYYSGNYENGAVPVTAISLKVDLKTEYGTTELRPKANSATDYRGNIIGSFTYYSDGTASSSNESAQRLTFVYVPSVVTKIDYSTFSWNTNYPIFEDRTQEIVFEKYSLIGNYPVKSLSYPDHSTFKHQAFKGIINYETYLGSDVTLEHASSGVAYLPSIVYSKTSYLDLNIDSSKHYITANCKAFYQDISLGLIDWDTIGTHIKYNNVIKGYYSLTDSRLSIINEIIPIEDGIELRVQYGEGVSSEVSSLNSAIIGDDCVITVAFNDGAEHNLQMVISGDQYNVVNGTVAIPKPTQTMIATLRIAVWSVSYLDDGNQFATQSVVDGMSTFMPVGVPIKEGFRFINWCYENDPFDFERPIKSDLVLIAGWEQGTVCQIVVDAPFGSATVSGTQMDAWMQFESGSSATVKFVAAEKIHINNWRIAGASTINIGAGQSSGVYSVSDDGYTLNITSLTETIYVSISAIFVSESNAPTSVISTDTPISVDDLVQKWYLGEGQTTNDSHQWAGGSSEPLIVDDFVFVREGESIFKIDANTGLVLATAETTLVYAYYHQMGYLGNGLIVDYPTHEVYNIDLEDQHYKVNGRVVYDPITNSSYGIRANEVCKYDTSNITDSSIENGFLKPAWSVDLLSSQTPFGLYGVYSQPVILGDTIYWLTAVSDASASGNDDGQLSTTVSIHYTSGSSVGEISLSGINGMYLDNGWLSTDGSNLYITAYTQGLFDNTSNGVGKVAVVFLNETDTPVRYYSLDGSQLASAFVVIDDIGFVKISGILSVYDMTEFDSNTTSLNKLKDCTGLDKSHGSIAVNGRHSDTGKYYVYFVEYGTGKLCIIEYDKNSNTVTSEVLDDSHSYSSQGIRTTMSGDIVYYDDSGRVYCYTSKERNNYYVFINDGTNKEMFIATGDDASSVMDASELITMSDGFLLGARTSQSEMSDGYYLFGMVNGVWVEAEYNSLSSLGDCNLWYVSKSEDIFPINGEVWSIAQTDESFLLTYVSGSRIELITDGNNVSCPVAAYPGMVLRIMKEAEEETATITYNGVTEPLSYYRQTPHSLYCGIVPSYDSVVRIGGVLHTVTLDLQGGESASVTPENGWIFDESSGTWSKEIESGAEFPEIAVPTKGDESGYAYVFQSWDPALPISVTESGTYTAVFEQRFTADNLIYAVTDPSANIVKVVGYEVEPIGTLEIPNSVGYSDIEYTVSAVAEGAFADCVGITSLVLNADTELHAFYRCYGLESITICEGVKSLGISTFAYSDSLKHVEFPSTLEDIGVNAFYKYSLYGKEGSRLAHTAENLAGKMFEGSSKTLRESFVAGGLKYTFQAGDSPSVKLMGYAAEPEGELVVPSSVEYGGAEYPVASVAQNAFRECDGITSVVLGANAGLRSFYMCSGLESVTICEGVTSIGVSAFAYCDSLKHVEFPSTLEKIGVNAFYKYSFYGKDGSKMTQTAKNLTGKMFEGTSKALRESFVSGGLKYTFQAGDSPSVKLMGYTSKPEGELVVPSSVEYGGTEYPVASVARDAFWGCDEITSVVLGANAGLHSFYRCSGLESVTICEGVTWIGVSAFAYCDGLKHVEFPSTLEKIGANAFYKYAFYGADGAKLAKTPADLAGKTFEGESMALYQVS